MASLADVFVEMHVDASNVDSEAKKAGSSAGKAFNQGADKNLGGGGVFAAAPQSPDVEKGGRRGGRAMAGAFVAGAAKALGPLATIFGVAQVGQFFKGTIDEASNLSEGINAVRVTYGKAADDILKIGKNSAKAFGLSRVELNNFAVRFSAFSGQIAGKGGDTAKVFENIAGRATDFASVMNLEVAEAAQLFQSGLAGETEPLRQFGIDLSAAAVEAHAVKIGLAESGAEMSEQQKVQARYSLLMKQTAKVQDDFKNTSDGLANQQRILAARFSNVRAELGAKLLPIATGFFTFLNRTAIPAAETIIGLFGSGSGGVGGVFSSLSATFEKFGGNSSSAVLVLELVGDAVRDIVKHGMGLAQTFLPALNSVREAAGNLARAILPILQQIANRIAVTFIDQAPEIKAIMTEVAGAVKIAAELIALHWSRMAKTIMVVWKVIGPFVLGFLDFVIKNIVTVLGGAVKIISGILTLLVGVFTGDFTKIKEGALKIFGGMWHILRGLFQNQGELIEKWIGGWVRRQVKNFMVFWSDIRNGFLKKWRTLRDAIAAPFIAASKGIDATLTFVWTKVIRPVVRFITAVFNEMGKDIRAVWRGFLRPVFELLGAIITWLWKKATRPAVRAIEALWKGAGKLFRSVWKGFLKPIIDAFGDTIQKLWKRFVRPAVDGIEKLWSGLGKLIKNVYQNTIGKVFGWFDDRVDKTRDRAKDRFAAIGDKWGDLGGGLRNTLNNRISKVFSGFRKAAWGMHGAFKSAINMIGNQWERLRNLAAKPVRFVLNTVLNKGLIRGFNKLAGFFDTDKLDPVPVPFKSGGVLPGYSPGRDIHRFVSPTGGALDLSGGEAIMRPEFTRAVGGERGVNALNRAARGFAQGGVFGGLSGGSGSFTDEFRQRLLMAQQLAGVPFNIFQRGFRPRTSYSGTSHQGDAVDLGPVTRSVVAALRRVGIAAWDRTGMGNWAPHIHGVPLPGAGQAAGSAIWQAQDFLRGGNGLGGRDRGPRGFLDSALSWIGGKASGLAGALFNPGQAITGAVEKLLGGAGAFLKSPFGEMASAMPLKLAKSAVSWIQEKVGGLFGAGGGAASWTGGGVGNWSKSQLDNAATIYSVAQSVGAGRRGALIGLMTAMQESTLRNLTWGDRDSVGLFQQRAPWGPFGARTNPAEAARMFFLGGRGGQPGLLDKAWRSMGLGQAAQAVQVSAFPGAYSKWQDEAAELVSRLGGHSLNRDTGGWLPPGSSVVHNGTGQREAVLNPEQWQILVKVAEALDRLNRGSGGAGDIEIVNNYYGPTTGSERLRDLRWQMKYGVRRTPGTAKTGG